MVTSRKRLLYGVDASNREQVVICLRRVDESFEPQEEFIGLYKVHRL